MFEFKFINWALVRQSNAGRQYDNLTVPFVVLDVPAGWSWELLIRHGADLNIIPMVESSSGELSYALTASDLAFHGEYAVQLRATSGVHVKHTSIEKINVLDSLSGDAQWPTLPTVFSEAVADAEEAADRAETAAETVEGKLDAPTEPGTAGQVLTLDENGNPKWADPQGGGGGGTWASLLGKPFETIGDNLKIVGRALTVDTASYVEQDNTKPITSAAVYTEVGNINALLALI